MRISMDKEKIKNIILFDNKCTLCNRFKTSLERITSPKEVEFLSIHNEETFKRFPKITFENASKEVHLVKIIDNEKESSESIFKGKEAITEIVKSFPFASKFSWLIESNKGQEAINYFHKKTERYRKILLERCQNCK